MSMEWTAQVYCAPNPRAEGYGMVIHNRFSTFTNLVK